MTLVVSRVWATVWATKTGAVAIEISGGNRSAVNDHLHQEEIVTGSISVSTIPRGRFAAHLRLWKFQCSGRLACIAVVKHAVSTVGGFG